MASETRLNALAVLVAEHLCVTQNTSAKQIFNISVKVTYVDEYFVYQSLNKSLLNVPPTILNQFDIKTDKPSLPKNMTSNIKGCSKLILFMIDGLGFEDFEKFANKTFFKIFKQKGQINKLTSVFPPTTAAVLTTLHTGLAPIEHGFFEWNLYMPSVGEIIESLRYKIIKTEYTDSSAKLPQDSSLIFNGKNIYETLQENHVDSVLFMPEVISTSIYAKAISKKSQVIEYKDLQDLLNKLVSTIESSSSQIFCNVYWQTLDKVEHVYGSGTKEAEKEIENLSSYLESDFLKKLEFNTALNTGILLTSDHGFINTDLDNITLLNKHQYLTERYKTNSKGKPILPMGSPRDIFLHIKQNKIDEVVFYLEEILKNKSVVIKLDKKTVKQLFGDYIPHTEFWNRLGNVLILSRDSHVCWYEYNDMKKLVKKAHHGSLLENEMIVPFGSAKASDLIVR